MKTGLIFSPKELRMLRLSLKHEQERLEFKRQSIDEESDDFIDCTNDMALLEVLIERIVHELKNEG